MIAKVVLPFSQETESSILDIAPDQECLDWICYRVRGGRDPSGDGPVSKPAAASGSPPGVRPGREDVARALGHLVDQGMLTCDGRRWSITPKGHEANDPRHRPPPARAAPAASAARAAGR